MQTPNKDAILEEAAIILEQSAWHKTAKDLRSLKDQPDTRSLTRRIIDGLIALFVTPICVVGACLGVYWYVVVILDIIRPRVYDAPLIVVASILIPMLGIIAFFVAFSKGEKK
jgi:hypothetical protein